MFTIAILVFVAVACYRLGKKAGAPGWFEPDYVRIFWAVVSTALYAIALMALLYAVKMMFKS